MGSIPACAGETNLSPPQNPVKQVYPRVCGGNRPAPARGENGDGLSPRVRGKHRQAGRGRWPRRSIPACAGETPPALYFGVIAKVYPRVCGGNRGGVLLCVAGGGLSPRVRGKLTRRYHKRGRARSIPACAGETMVIARQRQRQEVYPRVCGGNAAISRGLMLRRGLSPRVRGKPRAGLAADDDPGSIPACAGETRERASLSMYSRVYPRVCGGNLGDRMRHYSGGGLSPRVRGKPGRSAS